MLVLVASAGVVVTALLARSPNDPPEPRLVLERVAGPAGVQEIVASIAPGGDGRIARVGAVLRLRCDDSAGTSVLDAVGRLTDDEGTRLPHAHFALPSAAAPAIATCAASGDGFALRAALARP